MKPLKQYFLVVLFKILQDGSRFYRPNSLNCVHLNRISSMAPYTCRIRTSQNSLIIMSVQAPATNLKEFPLTVPLQRPVPLLISSRQLTSLIFQLLKLLKLRDTVHVTDLIVQSKECHRGVNCFSALGTQSYNLFNTIIP